MKKARKELDKKLEKFEPNYSEKTDIIELDEIYTYVEKTVVWTAFSRLQKRVITYHIGEGKLAAKSIL